MSTPSRPKRSATFPSTRKSPDPKGRGRPRTVSERFDFLAEDLIVETYGDYSHREVWITHRPTATKVVGHDPACPGSALAARKMAMHLLKEAVYGVPADAYVPPAVAGQKITDAQRAAVEAYLAENPKLKSPDLVLTAKFVNECIAWYNDKNGKGNQ